MDDCDRLYRRLVHNVRAGAPDLLTRPFEVSRLYQHLVSYRENRTALGFGSNDEYELALLQLLSGARGYLVVEPDLQHAMRAELESPNPDLAAYRAYATALVKLGPDPLREVMLRPTPEGSRAVSAPSPRDQANLAARPTEAVETPVAGKPTAPAPPKSAPPPASRPTAPQATRPAAPPPATGTAAAPSAAPAKAAQPQSPAMPVVRSTPLQARQGQSCRYCGAGLPEGRDVVYCPTCGHNLTVKHCPACNTELEVAWKFCITCGRETGG